MGAAKKVKVIVLASLRGKYKLPYTTNHVVELNEVLAKEIVENKDGQYFSPEDANVKGYVVVGKKPEAKGSAKAEAKAKAEAEAKAKAEAEAEAKAKAEAEAKAKAEAEANKQG